VVAIGGKFEWQKEERVVSLISFSFISMCVSMYPVSDQAERSS